MKREKVNYTKTTAAEKQKTLAMVSAVPCFCVFAFCTCMFLDWNITSYPGKQDGHMFLFLPIMLVSIICGLAIKEGCVISSFAWMIYTLTSTKHFYQSILLESPKSAVYLIVILPIAISFICSIFGVIGNVWACVDKYLKRNKQPGMEERL